MQITGVIDFIGEEQKITERFRKIDMAICSNDGQHEQYHLIEFPNDKVEMLDNFAEGETVTVSINLRGRKTDKNGETRYFNTLSGWKIERT